MGVPVHMGGHRGMRVNPQHGCPMYQTLQSLLPNQALDMHQIMKQVLTATQQPSLPLHGLQIEIRTEGKASS